MAKKTSKSTDKPEAKITRIKAADTSTKPAAVKPNATKSAAKTSGTTKNAAVKAKKQRKNPLAPLGRYFKGAWQELQQVRWPNRRSTWGMTIAVLLYTALFVTIIILLDLGFNKLLEALIG